MRRHLHQSLCVLCRHSSIPRLYSSHAAVARLPSQAPSEQTSAEAIPDLPTYLDSGKTSGLSEELVKDTRRRPRAAKAVKDTRNEQEEKVQSQEARLTSKSRKRTDLGGKRPDRNPLEPNNVDLYLASLRAAGKEPTIDDINSCRPKTRPNENSSKYAEEYSGLVDRLCRSFSKDQLRHFGEYFRDAHGLEGKWVKPGRRKSEYAECIVEKVWGWPNLKELERKRRDATEVTMRSFPVTASELFLLLGQDGSELLQISLDYNVHISVTQDPLALRIEGLRGALKQLDGLISSRKRAILEETIELPSKAPVRSDLLQRISRLAGAFIENVGYKGKVRICANDWNHLDGAKRLATRAAAHDIHSSHIPYLAYLPPDHTSSLSSSIFPLTYALYPFLPQRSLPWTMKVGGAFRTCNVGVWVGLDLGEEVVRTGGLGGGKGQLLDVNGAQGDIKSVWLGALPASSSGLNRVVTASTGHVLFTSQTQYQRASLSPPLSGYWQFPKFLKWLNEGNGYRAFVPSLPAPLHNAPPSHQKIIHRLIYRSFTPFNHERDTTEASKPTSPPPVTRVIKFEMTLAQRDANEPGAQGMQPAKPPPSTVRFDSSLDSPAVSPSYTSRISSLENDDMPIDETAMEIQDGPSCLKGVEAEFDLTLPDRPMDMKVTVLDFDIVPREEAPAELQAYYSSLKAFLRDPDATQPDPPLHITDGIHNYTLEVSASVRRSIETVNATPVVPDIDLDEKPATRSISTVTESILDLETNQKSMSCEIACENPSSDEAWKEFLDNCDRLTSLSYKPSSNSLKAAFANNSDIFA